MPPFRAWPSACPSQVLFPSVLYHVVRVVAVFGSAYYGIVKALHDQLEEFIRLKVEELQAEQ